MMNLIGNERRYVITEIREKKREFVARVWLCGSLFFLGIIIGAIMVSCREM